MSFPTSEVAGIAIQQILAQPIEGGGDASFEADRKEEAEYYAGLAIEEMKDEYGYDPAERKTARAKPAVIRYVKVSLVGQAAPVDQQFTMLADKWAQAVNRDANLEDRNSKDDEYDSRRIDLYDTQE
jgi:hypothetical protein